MKIINLKAEKKIEAEIKKIKNIQKETNFDLEEYIPSVNYIERAFYSNVERILETGFTPYLVGDSGTGKTAFAEWYGNKNRKPLLIVNCDYKNLRELLGNWSLENGATGPITIFRAGLLTKFLTSPTVILFDEVNSLEGEYLFFLHELLNNKKVFIPEMSYVFPVVATIILASNPTGRVYHGTQPLNFALLSRVVVVDVPHWTEEELKKIIKDEEIIRFYKEANEMSQKEQLGLFIGIRELLQYQALSKVLGKGEAIKVAFLNKVKCVDLDIAATFKGLASAVFGVEL